MVGRLIGRERECAHLEGLAVPGAVITLTGPGGVGKTRLVQELAARLEARDGRTAPIALLGAVAPGEDAEAVAGALGFESVGAATVVLAERRGSIVLDNCEHVLAAVREVVRELQAAVPELIILITSREALGILGEQVVVVEPLPLPGRADLQQGPSVELFLARARAAGAELDDDQRMLEDVAELCRRLDGLPLAIELAAARTRALAPGDLLEVVDERLDVLGHRAGSPRDTMRATIEGSTGALAPGEHAFFRRLGVFTGPFDLGLAHAVAGDAGSDRVASMDMLATLVERSLVSIETVGPTTRYRLLELLHDHAFEELRDAGELESVQEHFVEAMLDVSDRIVRDAAEQWDARLVSVASSQFVNLVRACELCLERDATAHRAYRLVLPMFAALHEGRPDEVLQLGRRVLDGWPDQRAPWRAEALAVLATAAAIAGRDGDVGPLAAAVVDDPEASPIAAALADRAWGLATRAVDHAGAVRHFRLARMAASDIGARSLMHELQVFEAGEVDLTGDRPHAMELLDDAMTRADEVDDDFIAVLADIMRARVLLRAGDVSAAESSLSRADARSAAMGQDWWAAASLRTAAAVASMGPDGWAGGKSRWRDALDSAARSGAVGEIALTLRAAATTALALGERDVALDLYALAPRSTAITVLSELFPEAAATLAGEARPPRSSRHLVDSLAAARALLGPVEPVAAAPASLETPGAARSGELARDGDGWRITFDGRTTRIRDMKGIVDLGTLVTRPGREVHALELMGGQDVGRAAGPALDERARRAYQDRIVELQREIDEARVDHDVLRAERAELELDALVEQLSEAFGLGGRGRSTGSSAERARTAVTYRIRAAIRRLSELHPELGRHLANAVRTGTWCSYQPEMEVHWTVVSDR